MRTRPGALPFVAAILLGAASPASFAAANDKPPTFNLFAGIDYGAVGEDEGSLGGGTGLLAGLEVQPWRRVGFELYLDRATHDRSFVSGTRFSGDTTFAGVSAVLHFGAGSPVEPFLLAGLGVLWANGDSRFPFYEDPPREEIFHHHASDFAWMLGGGVSIPVHPRVSIRPEVRFILSPASYRNRASLGVAVGFRF